MEKINPADVLKQIYIAKLDDKMINSCSKKELADFIMEIFNKGILNDYLNLKSL